MKKAFTFLLVFILLVSFMTGCKGEKIPENEPANNEAATNEAAANQTEQPLYEYVFRDLPEAKYITAASDFAGGDGSESSPYQISNAAELALLHEKLVWDDENRESEYQKGYYILTEDIILNDPANFDSWKTSAPEYAWLPIGYDTVEFKGVFDGQGHTISGLYINTNCGTAEDYSTSNYGLFDTVNGTVKNVTIDNSYFAVSGNPCGVGSIAGLLLDEAVVENCSSSATLRSYDTSCGGIVGKAYGGVDIVGDEEIKYSEISGCSFDGTITQARDDAMNHIGGIIGDCDGNVDACVNHGTISFAAGNVDSVGGIAGFVTEGTISACQNDGKLLCEISDEEALAIAGGIAGKVFVSATGSEKGMSRGVAILGCKNEGTVEAQKYAGGIAGQVSNDRNDYSVKVSECINNGTVSAKDYTGGIIGHMNCIGDNENGDSIVIERCENKADLSKGTVGGIVASFMSERGNVTIKDCSNTGALTADGQHCGGIVAYWIMNSRPDRSKIVVDGCTNAGNLSTVLNAGGIISFMNMPVCLELGDQIEITVANCNNSGNITTDSVNGYIGGVLGSWGMANISTSMDNCTNSGTLAITAAADSMTADDAEIITVSRIAGGIVGRVGSGLLLTTDSDQAKAQNVQAENAVLKITNSKNTGKIEVVNADAAYYKNWFGGIIGNTCGEDGFSVFVENCTYTGFERGLGNEDLPDVGTKN